jgi:hypothetical protein
MRRLTLTIDFECVTIIILDGDCAMWQCADDGVWPFPFASQFSFTE